MAFSPTPAATRWKYQTTESRTAVASVWSCSQVGSGCGVWSHEKSVFSSRKTPDWSLRQLAETPLEQPLPRVRRGGQRQRRRREQPRRRHGPSIRRPSSDA
jgi:hypothetical protein